MNPPPAFLPLSPGLGEVLLVLVVLLLLFGADRLPGLARSLGQWLRRVRQAADDFHDHLLEADLPQRKASRGPADESESGGGNSRAPDAESTTPVAESPDER